MFNGHFVSSFVKCLLKDMLKLGFLSPIDFNILYVCGHKSFVRYVYHKNFSQHVDCRHFLNGAFWRTEVSILMHFSSSFFSVIIHAFCVLLGNLCLFQGCKYLPPVLFSGNVMVPTFTFRSYDTFQVNLLCMVWGKKEAWFFFFFVYVSSCSSIICWKDVSFLSKWPWHFCWKSI